MNVIKYIKVLLGHMIKDKNESHDMEEIRSNCITSLSNILHNLILNYKHWEDIEFLKINIKRVIFDIYSIEKDINNILECYQNRLCRIVDILQSSLNNDEELKDELISQIDLLKKDLSDKISLEETIREINIQSKEMGNIYYSLNEKDKKEIDRIAKKYKVSFYKRNFSLEQLVFMSSGFFLCLLNMDIKYLTPNQIAVCKGVLQELARKQSEKNKVIHYYLTTINPYITMENLVNKDYSFEDQKWLDLENANI